MMQSITCVICTIKTWITSMSNLVVGSIVAQGVIIHEVCNNRNRNDYWRFHIARKNIPHQLPLFQASDYCQSENCMNMSTVYLAMSVC